MKSLLLLLLFSATAQASDLRLVGTNLYDFTLAVPHFGGSVYLFNKNGYISKIFSQSLEITIIQKYVRFRDVPESVPIEFRSHIILSQTMSCEAYEMLTMEEQDCYRPVKSVIYLLHPPYSENMDLAEMQVGQSVFDLGGLVAVPTDKKYIYDCGIRFNGDTSQFSIIYVVLPDRIIIRTNSIGNKTNVATSPKPDLERKSLSSSITNQSEIKPLKDTDPRTVQEWWPILRGKTMSEIKELFGKPQLTDDEDRQWAYVNMAITPNSGIKTALTVFFAVGG
ncbi:MAG TPA: hypothetical protein VHY30_06135 [Verrucomicrobiae bacterium]|jgi:hypothetical protein|nr:hypothetical protein [Verrucomicrobiae bacterium]